jgi:hypothetical protein
MSELLLGVTMKSIILLVPLLFIMGCTSTVSENMSTTENGEIKTLVDGTKYIINPNQLLSGGVPKGGIGVDIGIAAIKDPVFISANEATLSGDQGVLGLEYNGAIKAYPLNILTWHEIVNDKIGEETVVITFCPLCMSGLGFNSENKLFGVSGKLLNSNLVMYDQETDSYWNQLTGQAIVGPLAGHTLERIPIIPTTWGDWKEKHPDTLVMSEDIAVKGRRDYSSSPYINYFNNPEDTFGTPVSDRRLAPKELVFPVDLNNETIVYTEAVVKEKTPIIDTVGGEGIIVIWDESLETVRIFFTDSKDVTNWSVDRMEEELRPFNTFITYWFSWIAFKSETKIYTG